MTRSQRAAVLAVLMLTSLLTFAAPSSVAASKMTVPTLNAAPTIDGRVEEAEWGVADQFTFSSPDGTSTVRLGYIAETQMLAVGLVMQDATPFESGARKDKVEISIAPRTPTEGVWSQDKRFTVYRDLSWETFQGNGSGFSTYYTGSGSKPSDTNAAEWVFAGTPSAASWEVELLAKIGNFDAGDKIALGIKQTDCLVQECFAKAEFKAAGIPSGSFDDNDPTRWDLTTLTGRPSPVQFSLSPPTMEAAVGGDIIVTLPFESQGGRLTVQVKGPGDSGFIPIGTVQVAKAGANRFHFAPLKTGSWQVQAIWAGDGNYGAVTTKPITISVARPSPGGATVMETGSLRVAFAPESANDEGSWDYLNTKVRATDGSSGTLPLVTLTSTNSCRKEPWVGLANMDEADDSPMVIHLDPPVLRAAVALTSPKDKFTANIKAFTSSGEIKTEVNGDGSCSAPVFATLGDVEDNVARIEITYSGADVREVLDVIFPHPLETTPAKVTVRSDPWPLSPDGFGTVHVSAGSPHRVKRMDVTVANGASNIATRTCQSQAATGQTWIDCPIDVEVSSSASQLKATVISRDAAGRAWTTIRNIPVEEDTVPPSASLLPRPLLAPPGAAVAVTGKGEDASGIERIELKAVDQNGDLINEKSCTPDDETRAFECVMGVTPPAAGTAFVTGVFEDGAGNEVTLGPKPLPVRSADQDGDGLPDKLELLVGTSPSKGDTDGDGLSDGWEVVGVDRNGDGEAELDLAAMGADPQVRDLFMEFDWAVHDGHSHAPTYGALQLVRHALAARGIRLHTDIAQDGGAFDPARFDHGHAAHRHLIDPDRAGIFVHAVLGHMGGPAAGGGWAIYIPAAETDEQSAGVVGAQMLHEIGHLLELGHGGGGVDDNPKAKSPRVSYQENYKPQYLSVMNDAYAWGLYVDTVDGLVRVPSLSGVAVGNLDEKTLDEPAGLTFELESFRRSLQAGPTLALDDASVTGVRVRYTCPGDEGPVRWAFAPGAIDWNCNGGSEDTAVTADVNRGGANTGLNTLVSRSDWDVLSFRGPACPQYGLMLDDATDTAGGTHEHGLPFPALGLSSCPLLTIAETPLEEKVAKSVRKAEAPPGSVEDADGKDNDGDGKVDEGFADDDGDDIVNLIDDCPRNRNSVQRDRDRDGRGDSCEAVPPQVEDLEVVFDPENATVLLSWDAVPEVWGYNIYRVEAGEVALLGGNFPSTVRTDFEDFAGSAAATYIVRAVNDLAEQGIPALGSPELLEPIEGGNGPTTGVPSVGPLVTLVLLALGAVLLRRRRE